MQVTISVITIIYCYFIYIFYIFIFVVNGLRADKTCIKRIYMHIQSGSEKNCTKFNEASFCNRLQ